MGLLRARGPLSFIAAVCLMTSLPDLVPKKDYRSVAPTFREADFSRCGSERDGSSPLTLYSIRRTKLIENLQSSKPLRAFPRNRQTPSQGPSALLLSSQRVPAPLGRRLWTHPPVRARPCRSAFASVLECDGADLSRHIAFGQPYWTPIRDPC